MTSTLAIPEKLPIPRRDDVWGVLDSTKLQAYERCQRRYFYEYVLGWRSDKPNNHLIFGQAWHEALAHIYTTSFRPADVSDAFDKFLAIYRNEFPESTDEWFGGKTPLAALTALVEYCKTYTTDVYDYKVLDIEIGGKVPIGGKREVTVKMDMVYLRRDKYIGIMEHKTGSQAGRTWEMQWATSLQIGAYLHALNCFYKEAQDNAEGTVNGTFFYKKDQKFIRIQQIRSKTAMLEWLQTVHGLMDRVEDDFMFLSRCSDNDVAMNAFHMGPSGCTDYGGCPYFDLCSTGINPLRYVGDEPLSGFVHYWWNPLEGVKKDIASDSPKIVTTEEGLSDEKSTD